MLGFFVARAARGTRALITGHSGCKPSSRANGPRGAGRRLREDLVEIGAVARRIRRRVREWCATRSARADEHGAHRFREHACQLGVGRVVDEIPHRPRGVLQERRPRSGRRCARDDDVDEIVAELAIRDRLGRVVDIGVRAAVAPLGRELGADEQLREARLGAQDPGGRERRARRDDGDLQRCAVGDARQRLRGLRIDGGIRERFGRRRADEWIREVAVVLGERGVVEWARR